MTITLTPRAKQILSSEDARRMTRGNEVTNRNPRRSLEELIARHTKVYPEDDPRRDWIARALFRWAGCR